ncbi:MAG: molecular chaperone DnaJ [Candidatus Marinimicrobia bacterium]|nr:molecular chaperone DnaJ [Candidatus Neomarinimicrobiota bacterium]
MKDLYEIIGVSREASVDEIKKAYRKIAMKYHPDRNPGNSEAEKSFKEAAEAYAILNDQNKRAQYDQFGHAGVGMGGQSAGFGGGGGIHMSMEDIFSQFGDIFGGRSPFDDIFGGGSRGGGTYSRKAKDLKISLELDPIEILNGIEKTVNIKRFETCKTCDGSGARSGSAPSRCKHCGGSGQVRQISRTFFGQSVVVTDCPICHGEGEVIESPCADCAGKGIQREKVSIKINVPKGVASGNYMTLEGQGNKGSKGVYPGDLVVFFEEKEHKYFVRDDQDIHITVHLSYSDCALGTTIEVPTIEGKANLKVPSGIQSGQRLRMRGKGYPKLRSSSRGDQFVKIQIDTPKSLSNKEKELLNELSKLEEGKDTLFTKGIL